MNTTNLKHFLERNSGWALIAIFSLIPLYVWLTINPFSEIFADAQTAFYSFGKIFGIIGFVLFAINLVLSVRQEWLEDYFNGLNRVYIAHHLTGGLSLALISFHPLFLTVSNITFSSLKTIQDAATYLWPRELGTDFSTELFRQSAAFDAGIVAFIGMVVLLVITFFVKLPYHIWLFTHKFLGVAFLFAALHTLFISSDVSRNDVLFIYILGWSILGLGAYIYKTFLSNIFVKKALYKVEKTGVVAGNTFMTEMSAVGDPIKFQPGQFVFLKFKSDNGNEVADESHPFSIASSPEEGNLRFYIKALGDYTRTLDKLKPGALAEIEGAFGRFSYKRYADKPQIWIAGGIGVTPFLSMARSITAHSPEIDMFYSVVKRTEIVDEAALKDFLPQNYPKFKYHAYVYDEQQAFLTASYIKNQVGEVKNREIFICGPPTMMKTLRKQFRQLGVPNHRIHTEEFSMS